MDNLLNNLMTLDELSNWLGVRPWWVYRQTRLGKIPFTKVGKYLRFYRPDIQKWLETNTHRPVAIR